MKREGGGGGREREREREREGWVGGWGGGGEDEKSNKKFIAINNKRELADVLGKLAWFLEAGSSKLKRQK